jgi:hypothetical protein
MKIEPIVNYLEAMSLGVKGVSLFAYYMPTDVAAGILVIPGSSGTKVDPYIPKHRVAKFQVIVRANDYLEGSQLADSIANVLQLRRVTLSGVYFQLIRSTHEPIPFPPSDGNKIEFSLNFQAVYVSNFDF